MFHPSIEQRLAHQSARVRARMVSDGFVTFDDFLEPTTVESLRREVALLVEHPAPFKVRDRAGEVVLMNGIDKVSDLLFDLARHPVMMTLAATLLGVRAQPLHAEFFNKTAACPATPVHQDHAFYQEHFPDEVAVGLWLALDDAPVEAGVLEYSAQRHHALLPHRDNDDPSQFVERVVAEARGEPFIAAPVPIGGCIAHDSMVVHRSGRNTTARPRRSIVFNYRSSPYRQWRQQQAARS